MTSRPRPRPPTPAPRRRRHRDPRFPWKAKGTRKPLSLWDRTQFLLLFALLFELLVWNEYVRFGPPETWWDAQAQVAYRSSGCSGSPASRCSASSTSSSASAAPATTGFWTDRVFGGFNRRSSGGSTRGTATASCAASGGCSAWPCSRSSWAR